MLFYNNNKVNKLILLKHKLYFVLLCLFKTVLINLVKHNTVLLYILIISKKVKIITNLIEYTLRFS
jgi:hypothetical protein